MNIDKTSKDISTGQGSIGSNVKSTAHHEPQHEDERPVEDWSTAGIGNAFLFGKVMTANPDLLLELLQYSLPEYHIQKIIDAQREADVKLSIDSHGVRLDVLLSDDKGRRIDVEMQMRNEKNIPKRMRYYEGSIDQTILEKGQNYNKLGDLVILFITPFDPFETSGFYRYKVPDRFLYFVSANPLLLQRVQTVHPRSFVLKLRYQLQPEIQRLKLF